MKSQANKFELERQQSSTKIKSLTRQVLGGLLAAVVSVINDWQVQEQEEELRSALEKANNEKEDLKRKLRETQRELAQAQGKLEVRALSF
jgi:seryl-tRNA(Sec) selenium transferase